jgi:ADP-L-glycero-D-manno-heptose 6-epimerase
MLLVTGAAGFIGSNVLHALNGHGEDNILAVDDLTDGRKCQNLVGKGFADYMDSAELLAAKSLPKFNGIIHLGAISDTQFSNGRVLMENNFLFSKRMLALAEKHGCPIVYASSASVYGDGTNGFTEHVECEKPKSPYAFSKWAFDQYVRKLADHITVPVVGLRYFNVYGPGETHKGAMTSFAYRCFRAVQSGKKIQVFAGSQNFLRDFIYIDDAVDVTLFFLHANAAGIFNVGTGETTSFMQLAETIAAVTHSEPVEIIEFPESMRTGYQAYTRADLTKLRSAGWTHEFMSTEEGVERYWQIFTESENTECTTTTPS